MKPIYRLKPGGLMRCCIQSLDNYQQITTTPPKEGDTVRCQWCDDPYGMIFKDKAWQWNRIEA